MGYERKRVWAIEQVRWGLKESRSKYLIRLDSLLLKERTSESDSRLFDTQGVPNNWKTHRLMCVRNYSGVYYLIYAKVANCADKLPLSYLTYFPLPLSIS